MRSRPLRNRFNVVLTRNPSAFNVPDGVRVASSLTEALNLNPNREENEPAFGRVRPLACDPRIRSGAKASMRACFFTGVCHWGGYRVQGGGPEAGL